VIILTKFENSDKIWQFWQNLIILTIFDKFWTTSIYSNHKKVLLPEMHIVWQCVFGYKITHCLIWKLMLLINWFWKNYTMFLILKNIIYTTNFNFYKILYHWENSKIWHFVIKFENFCEIWQFWQNFNSKIPICLLISMNKNLKSAQQNHKVKQVDAETFVLDVILDIYFNKLWTSIYSKHWNLLLHELHIVLQCVLRVLIHSLFHTKLNILKRY
jgi:hypothetical protein